jgi:glycosyltransferase involved in cell wall biosynthesis
MKDVLIIIPAFNEEKSIGKVLQEIYNHNINEFADVLVINDASTDNTSPITKKYNVTVISHIFNLGYGSALQLGYKYAVRRGYNYVIQIDADGQHDISNIYKIYERLQQKDENGQYPDIVIGSRFLDGSVSFNISGLKKIAIKFFRSIIRLTTDRTILDPTSGLQGLNRKAFLYYSLFQNFNYTYPDANMIIQMLMLGYNIEEIPAIMHDRREGVSMHSGIIKPMIYMLIMPLSILGVYIRTKKGNHKTVELWSHEK